MMKHAVVGFILLLLSACGSNQGNVLLHDTQGKAFHFADLKGKWIFINYWATWCHPCTKEIPELNKFYQQHLKDVAVFGVNFDQVELSELKQLISKMQIRYPNLSPDPASLLGLGEIQGIPVTFVFNPQGKLVKKLYGEQTVASLNQQLIES